MSCKCSECGSANYPIYFHSKCHTGSPVIARLEDEMTLALLCSVCESLIVRLKVFPLNPGRQ